MWPDLISEVLHRADEDEAVELKPAETAEEDKTLPRLKCPAAAVSELRMF